MMFLEKVQKTIEKYHMIEKGDSIIVGVSGGAVGFDCKAKD